MTPQEKAKELLLYFNTYGETYNAKQCALITAENVRTEMLKLQNYEQAIYWRNVKREIRVIS